MSGAPRQDATPPRRLGALPATALVAGSMLGVGIFIGPPAVAGLVASPAVFLLLWLAGGVTALCGALAVAELRAMMPRSGGHYVFLRRAYGPGVAFAAGWLQLLAVFPGSIATLALALGTFQLPALFGPAAAEPFALAGLEVPSAFVWGTLVVLVLTAINHAGIVVSGRLQVALTIAPVLVFFVAAVAVLAFGVGGEAAPTEAEGDGAARGVAAVAAAYLPVYFAYAGWDGAIYVGGEIERPGRTIPLALVGGTGIVTGLYVVLCMGFLSVFSMGELAVAGEAGSAAAERIFGDRGVLVVTSLILAGMLGSLNGQVLSGSRIGYAMALDREFLPAAGRLHPRFATPVVALWLQAAWTVILMATRSVEQVLDYATSAMLLTGILTVLAVAVLRRREPEAERPYRAALYPLTPAVYVASSAVVLAVLAFQGAPSVLLSAVWFLGALGVYHAFHRGRAA